MTRDPDRVRPCLTVSGACLDTVGERCVPTVSDRVPSPKGTRTRIGTHSPALRHPRDPADRVQVTHDHTNRGSDHTGRT